MVLKNSIPEPGWLPCGSGGDSGEQNAAERGSGSPTLSAHASAQAPGLWRLLSLEVGAGLGRVWTSRGCEMLQAPFACARGLLAQSCICSDFEPWFLGPDPAPLQSQVQWRAEVAG